MANALAAGAPPRTPLGELTTLPRPLIVGGWGGDTTPPRSAPLAFGARYSAPSAPWISRLRRSILAFPLLLIYEMTTDVLSANLISVLSVLSGLRSPAVTGDLRPIMTYNVFGGMLSLTQSINQLCYWLVLIAPTHKWMARLS